jgi:hypothetical protein
MNGFLKGGFIGGLSFDFKAGCKAVNFPAKI